MERLGLSTGQQALRVKCLFCVWLVFCEVQGVLKDVFKWISERKSDIGFWS